MPLTNNSPIDWSQIKHFKKEEFTCNCGCGLNNIHKEVVLMLDAAREISGVPFRINCGCRCEKHNREVGGVLESAHTKGYAVDIAAITDAVRFHIVSALLKVGFKRVILYSSFIHCDDDLEKVNPILKIMI